MSRFIKFIPSEKSDFLQKNYPSAFLLLCLIAQRARRISDQSDGLMVGDAILGDYEAAGLSRQQYRSALDKLVELGYVDIIYNGKKFLKREKSTIKVTITGTLVNLKDSSIWDINAEQSNQYINQRSTNDQPTTNHKQERTRKNKKEEEQQQEPAVAVVVSFEQKEILKEVNQPIIALYDCLKQNKELSNEEKEILLRYDEKRVNLALEFAKKVKPKTTLIQMLRWHCNEKNPPLPPVPKYTDQQKIAIDFNHFLLSVGQKLMHEQNINLIPEDQIITPHGSISLKNPISVLRRDFDEIKNAYRMRKYV